MAYQRRAVPVTAVRWTGDAACLAGTPFTALFTGDRDDGALVVGERLCRVDDWVVSDGTTPIVVASGDFAALYEEEE